MKKLEVLKQGVDTLVGIGVGMIAGAAIGMVPVAGGILVKIAVKAGSIALEGMIVDQAVNYTEKKFDEIVEMAQKAMDNLNREGEKEEEA